MGRVHRNMHVKHILISDRGEVRLGGLRFVTEIGNGELKGRSQVSTLLAAQ